MVDVIIIRSGDVDLTPPPGASGKDAGWIKRIVYPPHTNTKGSFMGVAEVNPGFSVHRWHRHVTDKAEGYEVIYPKDFEEIYHIVRGSGVIQWKTEEGKIREEKVSAGDTMLLPIDVAEHQLFNSGTEKMSIVFCGSPTPKVTLTYK
jgi:oxalate decarboxylase/phosphoglucose isomerase-like protein (cupin superfamily)